MTAAKKLMSLFVVFLTLSLISLVGCSGQVEQSQGSASSSSSQSSSALVSDSQDANDHIDISVQIDASAAKDSGVDTSSLDSIVGPANYQLTQDATAYDALVATGAELDGTPSYITSINGIAEGSDGKSSGWMYEVNGEAPTVAANECGLQNGDTVRWYFSSWE